MLERCSIYEARPLICRAFGADPEIACPHGCEPERKMEAGEMRAAIRKAGRL